MALLFWALWLALTQPSPPENCLSVVGDSIPYGDVVYMVPGHGFGILRATPLSDVLQDFLPQYGLDDLEIRDRSASAAYLSDLGRFPYHQMDAYPALLNDHCRFTVIMPWANDMSIERDHAAAAHVDDLIALVEELQAANPQGQIIILGFYYAHRADFVEAYAPHYTDENVDLFNEALFAACERDQELGRYRQVSCMDTTRLFIGLDNQHVVLNDTQERVLSILYEEIPADVAPYFETFWRDNPNGLVIGDGVHLSEEGKVILAEAIILHLLSL